MHKVNTKKTNRKRVSRERMAEALKLSGGIMSEAGRMVGLDRHAVWNYVHNYYPELQEVINEAKERTGDLAESKLIEKVREGNTSALFFYLKCQHKKRGYIERVENELPQESIDRQLKEMSYDELMRTIRELEAELK